MPRPSLENLSSNLQRQRSAQSLAEALGKTGRARRLGRRIDKNTRRVNQLGGNDQDFLGTDFSSGIFDVDQANALFRSVTGSGEKFPGGSGKTKRIPRALFTEEVTNLLTARQTNEGREFFEEEVDPFLEDSQDRARKLLDEQTINAREQAALRSTISNTVRGAEAKRLNRVGAALGLRGLDASSPAGAALATATAEAADRELADQFRELGLDISEINAAGQREDTQLLNQLTLQRGAGRDAALNGDLDRLIAVQQNTAALFEAVRASATLKELLSDQFREQESQFDKQFNLAVAGTSADAAGSTLSGITQGLGGF